MSRKRHSAIKKIKYHFVSLMLLAALIPFMLLPGTVQADGGVLAIDTGSLSIGGEGLSYNCTVTASGGTAPYTWSASGLPAGLTIDTATGVISGTPAVANTYTVDITVTDSSSTSVTRQYSLRIVLHTTTNTTSTSTSTSSIPAGIVGEIYTHALGSGLIKDVPPGLGYDPLTGVLSGTPTTVGSYNVMDKTSTQVTSTLQELTVGGFIIGYNTVVNTNTNTDQVNISITPVPTYTITFDSLGGSPAASINGVTSGSTVSAPAVPAKPGYTFGGWYKEASCTNAWDFNTDTVTVSKTLYAKWTYNGGDSGGGDTPTSSGREVTITSQQISEHLHNDQSINLNFPQLNLSIDPAALPADGSSVQVTVEPVTDSSALNTFFLAYPDQKGIRKGYSVTFTSNSRSGTQNLTQLNGEIILTFALTPEELEGIDPGTLVVYKQGGDGQVIELRGEFDWSDNIFSVSTDHLCKFFIMGKQGIPAERLEGANRYATAAAVSTKGWQTSENVILASGENFPDALAGTVLAGIKDAPVLLTDGEAAGSETLAEIKRLEAKNIYILGGTSVISKGVEEALAEDYTVTRIFGLSRYETAVNIGQIMLDFRESEENKLPSGIDTVILSTGSNYPDALSIAPFAGQYSLPILYTEQDSLNDLTKQALSNWGIKKVILIGGTGVISGEVEDLLKNKLQLSVTRLGRQDRYLTSLEIARYFADFPGGEAGNGASRAVYKKAALATGENYPDALAGASLAAKLKMPVLLVGKEKVSREIKDYLQGLDLEKLYVYGGQGAVKNEVKEEISER